MIRNATRSELTLFADWANAEGWNPGLDDPGAFWEADPDGFFVFEQNGQPAACISVVNHSDSFSFLGFYICRPDLRGTGLGMALWNHAMTHAGHRTVGLDGVADQQANYRKSGFVRTGATTRYEGHLPFGESIRAKSVEPSDMPALLAMDHKATGVDRSRFLRSWITDTSRRKTYVLHRDAEPIGFATLRQCRTGYKVGPTIAASMEDAEDLLHAVGADANGAPVFIDIPESQTKMLRLVERWRFNPVFATARMYRGPAPQGDGAERSIATMELG